MIGSEMLKKLRIAGVITFIVLILCFCVLMVWQVNSLKAQNRELVNRIGISEEVINNSIRRAETKTVETTRELQDFADQNRFDINEIKEDINKLGASLEAISSTIAETKEVRVVSVPSSRETPSKTKVQQCPDDGRLIDTHEYTKNTQHRELNDDNGMRIADVSFDASNNNPWSYKVYGIRYIVNSALSRDKNGKLVLHSELLSENREVSPGSYYKINNVSSKLLQIENKPEFDAWDPAVYLSISSGVNFWPEVQFSAAMNLDFSVMSYGAWRFIGVGVGFDGVNNTFNAAFFPFAYNIAEHIPVVSNIYLSPYISINHENTLGAGIRIGVRL